METEKLIDFLDYLKYEGYCKEKFCFYINLFRLNFEIVYNNYGFFTFQYFKHSQDEEPTKIFRVHINDISLRQFAKLEKDLYTAVKTIDETIK